VKNFSLHIIILLLFSQLSLAQDETSTIALELPVRNSLMFNRHLLSPTFSFVREDNRFITINNKREFAQLEDSQQTYQASFSGKFSEKIGAGLSIFQRNFGLFTTFGGIANFAYNAEFSRDSNLTFGLNLAAYSSGINTDNVISTSPDPLLNDITSNFIGTISPGINYGGSFLDVGVTINNLVTYNVSTSTLLEEGTQRGIQAHLMHTGYIDSYGFFDNSRFSALAR